MTYAQSFRDAEPLVLTVPGLGDSGPGHWQTLWEAQRDDCFRVDLGMWNSPERNSWVTKLNQAIGAAGRPVVLAAHSLGCHAVAWWAALERSSWAEKVVGALLVAPPEVDFVSSDPGIAAFGPAPKGLLPFPSILVASRSDPYIRFDRARLLAGFWGSEFIDAGDAGHVNADSDLGEWDFGQDLLNRLLGDVSSVHSDLRGSPAVGARHILVQDLTL